MHHQKFRALPRIRLIDRTPLMPLPRLGNALGDITLYIKRDDIGTLGGGGNKLRKLEFLLPPAIAQGCDTLITFGALQSNHARLTAAAAASLGMKCHLILNRKVPRSGPHYEAGGNLVLDKLFGASLHELEADADPLAYCEALKGTLVEQGHKPWVIPFGGSDAHGAMGYVPCVAEIIEQAEEQKLSVDHLVHASGSGGMQAGLIMGAQLYDAPFSIQGISVLHPANTLRSIVSGLVNDASALLDGLPHTPKMLPEVDDRFVGPGYGQLDERTKEALYLMATTEGIILDPVYTGKAFAGLVAKVREGQFKKGDTVVFVHSGGMPGVFAYSDALLESSAASPSR